MPKDTVLCIDCTPLRTSRLWAVLGQVLPLTLERAYAADANTAMAVFRQLQQARVAIPLVVCVQSLPDQPGDHLLRQLRTWDRHTYSILITDLCDQSACGDMGNADDIYRCLAQPWQESDLKFTVRAALQQAQLSRQHQQQTTALQELEHKLIAEGGAHIQTRRHAQMNRLRLARLLEHLEQVVWSMSPETMQLQALSPATASVYGRDPQAFLTYPQLWLEVVHPADQALVAQARQALLERGMMQMEYRIIRPNGEIRWLRDCGYVITDSSDEPLHIEGIITDMTHHQRAMAQHQYDVLHDELTGLPNRSFLTRKLNQALTRSQQQPEHQFAVLLLDLDRFNVINDGLGYHVGDQVLVAIANQLQEFVRKHDCVARLEGDEFTILLDRVVDVAEATQIAERILDRLSARFDVAGQAVFLSASMGIVLNSEDYHEGGSMLRDAAIAMNRAKSLGKARHILFNPNMHAQTIQRMQLESDLRLACIREEFVLHYQPIIGLATGQLCGFEALIRWQHPERGLVPPAEFIGLAEETGLIIKMGKWALRQACLDLGQLQALLPENNPVRVSVNLAGPQLQDPQLIKHVDTVLRETQVHGLRLKLELTESMLMRHEAQIIETLQQLCDRGIELSLDDFGTGYSSLSYLNRFPIHTLKIDRSFVDQMCSQAQDLEIIRAIITLAHTLRMNVIAEGIETEHQATLLQRLGCEYGQGYFFSPPLDFERLQHHIATTCHWGQHHDPIYSP